MGLHRSVDSGSMLTVSVNGPLGKQQHLYLTASYSSESTTVAFLPCGYYIQQYLPIMTEKPATCPMIWGGHLFLALKMCTHVRQFTATDLDPTNGSITLTVVETETETVKKWVV